VENAASCNSNLPSTDSVAILSTTSNTITNITYLGAGTHPVAMAETPDARNLYVLNQGTNSVSDLSPADLSTLATIPVGSLPTWIVSRQDSRRVYVLTQGGGQLIPIDTATNTILSSQTNLNVGAGANFVLYDHALNRLYVTNPATGIVYVFSATGGVDSTGAANDTPTLLATLSMTGGANPPCPNGCSPVSVTALPDGSRFYVASYELESACQDPNVVNSGGSPAPCMIPMLTVFDAASITVKPVSSTLLAAPSLSLLTSPPFSGTQYAVAQASSCVTAATYSPDTVRFRMFTTSSIDSTHVYVSICDAGVIADIDTVTSSISTGGSNNPDTVMTDIAPPFSSGPIQVNGEPLNQSPVFLLTGQ
jgi:DNA-binding beta-propeller fold protein YncE